MSGVVEASDSLDSDAFMQLLLTQLAYQDPTQPMDNAEMVSQLADLTMLEQNAELVSAMENLSSQIYDSQGLYASSLVGKGVMVIANLFVVENGRMPEGEVLLNYAAEDLNVEVYEEKVAPDSAEPQAVLSMGVQNESGQIPYNLKDLETELPDGKYMMYAYAKVDGNDMEMMVVQRSVVLSVVIPGGGQDVLVEVEGIGLVALTSITEFEGDYTPSEEPVGDTPADPASGDLQEIMAANGVDLKKAVKKVDREGKTWTSNPLFNTKKSKKSRKKKPVSYRQAMFRTL